METLKVEPGDNIILKNKKTAPVSRDRLGFMTGSRGDYAAAPGTSWFRLKVPE